MLKLKRQADFTPKRPRFFTGLYFSIYCALARAYGVFFLAIFIILLLFSNTQYDWGIGIGASFIGAIAAVIFIVVITFLCMLYVYLTDYLFYCKLKGKTTRK